MEKVKIGPWPRSLWASLTSIPHLTPPAWLLGRSGPWARAQLQLLSDPHSTQQEEDIWAAYAKSVSFEDRKGRALGTHNIVVCKDLLKISPPFFRAASLHAERTSKWKRKPEKIQVWAQVILAERDRIDASKNSTTYIHFKLKKEIFLERQNPE